MMGVPAKPVGSKDHRVPWRRIIKLRAAPLSRAGQVGVILLALAALLPVFGGQFYVRLAIEAMLFGLLALSVDILLGFAGRLSLGQAAFFGIGAYMSAILFTHVTTSFWLVLLAVIGTVTLFSAAIGAIVVRTKGIYFALITLAVSEVLHKITFNTRALGGSDGLIGVPQPTIDLGIVQLPLSDDLVFFYVMLTVLAAVYLMVRRLLNTPFGAVLGAVRDNEERLPYLGYNPFGYKLGAFVVAAQIAALGGMMYPLLRGFVSPDLFGFEVATKAVVMTLVGGIGTLVGPLAGGGIITFLESLISGFTERHLLVTGLLFIVFVLYRPDGLLGFLHRRGAARVPD